MSALTEVASQFELIYKKKNPFWDGDGVQGVGQPRDFKGRWTNLPGSSVFKKVGVWEREDGSFGVYVDDEERSYKKGSREEAFREAAKIYEYDSSKKKLDTDPVVGRWLKLPGNSPFTGVMIRKDKNGKGFNVHTKFMNREVEGAHSKHKTAADAFREVNRLIEEDKPDLEEVKEFKKGDPVKRNGEWGKFHNFDGQALLFDDKRGIIVDRKDLTGSLLNVKDRKAGYGGIGVEVKFKDKKELDAWVAKIARKHEKTHGPIVNEKLKASQVDSVEPNNREYAAGQFWSSGFGYNAISGWLREGKKVEDDWRYDISHKRMLTHIKHLDAYMNKNKNKEEFVAYRGVHSEFADFILGLEEGDEFQDDGYVAVAKNRHFADFMAKRNRKKVSKVTFEVVVPPGIGVFDLDSWRHGTFNPGPEQEVVLERGLTLKVISNKNGVVRVKAVKK